MSVAPKRYSLPAGLQQDAAEAEAVILEEARCLDEHRWQDWLDLYVEDARFWLPSWRSQSELIEDPARELSLIYYEERARLEERVWRLTSGRSAASSPLHRTLHLVSDIRMIEAGAAAAAKSNFVVHLYDVRQRARHMYFGRYEHVFRRTEEGLRIAAKKVILLNDHLPSTLDIYTV